MSVNPFQDPFGRQKRHFAALTQWFDY